LGRNSFAKPGCARQFGGVTQPLALIYYQKLLPGSTLANRLRDLNYRVHVAGKPQELASVSGADGPMFLLVDVNLGSGELCQITQNIRQDPKTSHLPILAFAEDESVQAQVLAAGATVAASDVAVVTHLEELLERLLRID
jgi:CheY-like chemotaxis protein